MVKQELVKQDADHEQGLAGVAGELYMDGRKDGDLQIRFERCANYGQVLGTEGHSHTYAAGIVGHISDSQYNTIYVEVDITDCLNMAEGMSGFYSYIDGCDVYLQNCLSIAKDDRYMNYATNSHGYVRFDHCYYLSSGSEDCDDAVGTISETDIKDETYLEEREFYMLSTWRISADVNHGYPHLITQEEENELIKEEVKNNGGDD